MKTQIQSIHFVADDQLKTVILDKISKLEKIFKQIESCMVTLRLENNSQNKNKVVEINVVIPSSRLFVVDKAEKFEVAVKLAIEEMKRQLKKRKEEMKPQQQKIKNKIEEVENVSL